MEFCFLGVTWIRKKIPWKDEKIPREKWQKSQLLKALDFQFFIPKNTKEPLFPNLENSQIPEDDKDWTKKHVEPGIFKIPRVLFK